MMSIYSTLTQLSPTKHFTKGSPELPRLNIQYYNMMFSTDMRVGEVDDVILSSHNMLYCIVSKNFYLQ